MPTDRVQLYDTTLRDGSQMEGISLSVEDKVRITRKLDELGLEWVEGGFPGSNPKDAEYFRRLKDVELRNAKVSAFGGTRKANSTCETDPNIQSLVAAETPGVTLVGKASLFQVREILGTSAEENLAMVRDSIAYIASQGREAFFDAEHFFDGFFFDPEYALNVVRAADRAGARRIVLCDTNGGMVTGRLVEAIKAAGKADPKAIQAALWNVKVKGINGDIAFIKQGPAGKESAQNVPAVYLVRIDGGKVVKN